ncbi:MAG: RNA helicase [Flavobacteriaceae bacterium]|jgi:hypothetical protein|nr:RNA helicase [Flavobacteriaceae bacterium]
MSAKKNVQEEDNVIKENVKIGKEDEKKIMCGIIMPISDHKEYPIGHWKEVEGIIKDVLSSLKLHSRIVSDDDSVGLIQERIVTNIYNDDIIVCDVSSKNPNVMFELGLRLAFDKPTIIVIDDKTNYSFDIGSIEHISYPSSLRFGDILSFKEKLAQKIEATLKKKNEDSEYSPFLKSFGRTIKPAKINNTEIPINEFVIEKLDSLHRIVGDFVKDKEVHVKINSSINNRIDLLSTILNDKEIMNEIKESFGNFGSIRSISNVKEIIANHYPNAIKILDNSDYLKIHFESKSRK